MKINHTINEGFNNLDIKSEIKEVCFVSMMFKKLKNRIYKHIYVFYKHIGTYDTNGSR